MPMYIFKKLKRSNRIFFACFFTVLVFGGCEAIFENDISKSSIVIKAPIDHYVSSSQEILFWWEELSGATSYHIQIVNPNFDSVAELVLDTIVTTNKITVHFEPGHYQWAIRGENSAYFTEYFTQSFTVYGNEDLTHETIYLLQPADSDTTNSSSIMFSWESLQYASNYLFELWFPDLNGTCINTVTVYSPQYQYTLPSDTTYTWRVRAENDLTNTPYSYRTIYIDTHTPTAPVLLSPTNSDTVTNPMVTFQWEHDNSGGSRIYDSIFVATDNGFLNLLINDLSITKTYNDSLASGVFYWKVRSYDAAGNTGSFSNIFQFVIQ